MNRTRYQRTAVSALSRSLAEVPAGELSPRRDMFDRGTRRESLAMRTQTIKLLSQDLFLSRALASVRPVPKCADNMGHEYFHRFRNSRDAGARRDLRAITDFLIGTLLLSANRPHMSLSTTHYFNDTRTYFDVSRIVTLYSVFILEVNQH